MHIRIQYEKMKIHQQQPYHHHRKMRLGLHLKPNCNLVAVISCGMCSTKSPAPTHCELPSTVQILRTGCQIKRKDEANKASPAEEFLHKVKATGISCALILSYRNPACRLPGHVARQSSTPCGIPTRSQSHLYHCALTSSYRLSQQWPPIGIRSFPRVASTRLRPGSEPTWKRCL